MMGHVLYSRELRKLSLADFLREYFAENKVKGLEFVWHNNRFYSRTGFLGGTVTLVAKIVNSLKVDVYDKDYMKKIGEICAVYAKIYNVTVIINLVEKM